MDYELIFFFFAIAFLYSSVGFGGGSSYLAILSLYSFEYRLLRTIALVCNLIVVSGGTYLFAKQGHINWKKTLPLVLVSVPLAFIGARIPFKENVFFILLGSTLIIAGIIMLLEDYLRKKSIQDASEGKKAMPIVNGAIGGGIGLLAGSVGIGGGIFLSPLLHIMHWDKAKTIAGTASFFILINSASGLAGQLSQGNLTFDFKMILYLGLSVLVGGQLGSRLSVFKLSQKKVKILTALLVLFAGGRLLLKYLV
ncbi:sulfite exporter TauE/SafE family protein [uncultured Roseivirga sp.]|uniref:sulfite exporter TauE/SafE family protein n=1 Tax=uncultured Roseivirga sp. TaxID=543088 RepID=UPI0030DDB9CD|tara:strand:- start:60476 stop:61234 length:759 start_codon:yes stop_codon:yes gene_type:complete